MLCKDDIMLNQVWKWKPRLYKLTINIGWFSMFLAKRESKYRKAVTCMVHTGHASLMWLCLPHNISLFTAEGLGSRVWVTYSKGIIRGFGGSGNWGSLADLELLRWQRENVVRGKAFLFYLPLCWCQLWWFINVHSEKIHFPFIQRLNCIFCIKKANLASLVLILFYER